MKFMLVFTAILLFSCGLQAQISHNIDLYADVEITGDWRDVVVDGEILYFANAYGLMVYRFNPDEDQRPVEITHIATPGIATGLCLRDTLLYLADGYNGLLIFSVADPEFPRQIGHCAELTDALYVDVADNYAYVTNVRGSLAVVSVENPEVPEIVRFVEGNQRMSEIYYALADDDYLYLSSVGGTFLLFDRSDPSNPQELSRVFCGSGREGGKLLVNDGLVYFASADGSKVISLENPGQVEIVGEFEPALDFRLRDQYLYGFCGNILVWELNDPLQPQMLQWINGPAYGPDLDLMDDFAICAGGIYGPRIVNISNPENIFFTEDPYIYGIYGMLDVQLDMLYVTNHVNTGQRLNSGFKVFSLENYLAPQEIASFDFQGMSYYIDIDGNYAYLGSSWANWDGLYVVSIEDLDNMELRGHYNSQGSNGVTNIIADGQYLIAINDRMSIHVSDVSDPNNPRIIQYAYPFERVNDVHTDGRYVFATGYNNRNDNRQGVTIYSRDEFPELVEIGTCETTVFPGHMISFGDYLYVNNYSSGPGLSIVSIADPTDPIEVNIIEEIGAGSVCLVSGNFLIVGERYGGIKVFSLINPEEPELLGWYDTPGRLQGLTIRNDYLTVGDRYAISQYDISRATGSWNLELSVDHIDFDSVTVDTSVIGEFSLTNDGRLPVEILDINIDNPVFSLMSDTSFTLEPAAEAIVQVTFNPNESIAYEGTLTINTERRDLEVRLTGRGQPVGVSCDVTPVPLVTSLSAPYPNPFNSTIQICYSIPYATDVKLSIYDVSGRLVNNLVYGKQNAGFYNVFWKGDNRNGIPVTSGIYFFHFKAGSFMKINKMMLIK